MLEEGNAEGLVRRRADPAPRDRLGGLPGRRWSGGSCRRGTSIRSSTSACCKNRELAASIFLFVVARLRALRRRVHLPAVHAGHPRLHADGDRARDAARRPRDRGQRAHLRPAAQRREAAGRRARPDRARHRAASSSSMWKLGHLTTAAGEADVALALIIRGVGARLAVHADQQRRVRQPQAAARRSRRRGSINLSRQLGGSFGIAVLGTYLTRHVAVSPRRSRRRTSSPATRRSSSAYAGAVAGSMAHGSSLLAGAEARATRCSTVR